MITGVLIYDLVTADSVSASPTTLANGLADAMAAFAGSGYTAMYLQVIPDYSGNLDTLRLTVVPEPSSVTLMGLAALGLVWHVRRRRSSRKQHIACRRALAAVEDSHGRSARRRFDPAPVFFPGSFFAQSYRCCSCPRIIRV